MVKMNNFIRKIALARTHAYVCDSYFQDSLLVIVITYVTIKNTFHKLQSPMYKHLRTDQAHCVIVIRMQTLRCTYFGDASRLSRRHIMYVEFDGLQSGSPMGFARIHAAMLHARRIKKRTRDFPCVTRRLSTV